MAERILNTQALNEAGDLKKASEVQEYGLGLEVETIDENNDVRKYIYVKAGAALDAKDTVMVNPGFVAVAPSTSAFAKITGVANIGVASGSFFFLQIKGKTIATSTGNTTADHYTKLVTTAKTVADSSSVVASTNAIINETRTGSGDVSITLLGTTSEVAAS
jgi:hypothetical protein